MSALLAFQNASRSSLGLDGLRFVLQEDWGSQNEGYRLRIREDVLRTFMANGIVVTRESEERLRDLDRLPAHPELAICVSHCRSLGGYAWIHRTALLGFDIEEEKRVTPKTAERVSTPEELKQAPHPALLWVAKEAAYKALSAATHAATVSEMETSDWARLGTETAFWSFTARVRIHQGPESYAARGVAGLEDGFAAAIVFSEITQNG